VAYAARRIAALVGSPELIPRAGDTLRRVMEATGGPHMLDVIGGNAGAIPALLEIGREPGRESCRDLAVALGEELCRAGDGSLAEGTGEAAASLKSFAAVGLAHGASGIGLALYELHAATGRCDFREAARRTFDREDTLFIRERGNWARIDHPSDPPRFEVAWCHGAAGIALARCRAAGLDPDRGEAYRAMARLAIAATLATLERGLASPRSDASSCHGMIGLMEILGIAADALGDPSCREASRAASRILIDRHAEPGDWPSGLRCGGPNPSLMIGTAGIGYTFLRLHDPEHVPSVLWIGA
jgi:lantibiotic modifying enzyme